MSPPDRILALDIATSTGWATIDEFDDVVCGHERFEGPLLERLIKLDRWMREGIAQLGPALIAVEGQFMRGRNSILLGAMVRVVKDRCQGEKIACLDIRPQDAKRAVGCSATASKQDVITAVATLGYVCDGSDEADAIAVLVEAMRRSGRARAPARDAA